jgi:acyl carrier protein
VRRAWLAAVLLAGAAVWVPPATAVPAVPFDQIVDGVRSLAAQQLGRKPGEVDTVSSLFGQGLTENGLTELVIAIQQEFGVVIPDDEIHHAKYDDNIVGLSVRRLASIVARHSRQE